MSEILKIDDIINLLDKTNKTLEDGFFINSSLDPITVKPMNAHHSKNILKSLIDGPFASTQFTLTIYHVLKDTVVASLKDLTILDKALLLLQMRVKNIGNTITVKMTGVDKKNKEVEIEEFVDLKSYLDNLKQNNTLILTKTIEDSGYSCEIYYPSIEEDYRFEENFYKTKILPLDENDVKARRGLTAPIFLNTIAQYIKILKIGDNEIVLKNRSVDERLAIVEKLPTSLLMKIIKEIDETYGKELSNRTFVKTTKNSIDYFGNIDISAALFINA